MNPASKISLQQLAETLGYAKSTVSMALRDDARVASKTRLLIQAEAARLGYAPDADLACLMAQIQGRKKKTYQANIAVLSFWGERPAHIATEGCRARAGDLGYNIDLIDPVGTPGAERDLRQVLRARGIRAAIFLGWPQNAPLARLRSLARVSTGLPCVVVNACPQNLTVHSVMTDAFAALRRTFACMMEMGYRRPALFISSALDVSLGHTYTGAFLAMQQQELAASDRLAPQAFTAATVTHLADYLREQQPDCLLCHDPLLLAAVRKSGLRVPEDIGYISLDLDADQRQPGLAGIDQQHRLLGASAVDVVVAQILRAEPGDAAHQKSLLIEGAWSPGTTIQPQR